VWDKLQISRRFLTNSKVNTVILCTVVKFVVLAMVKICNSFILPLEEVEVFLVEGTTVQVTMRMYV